MKKSLIVIIYIAFIFYSKISLGQNDIYHLGPDDVISISIFDEPDLSLKEARVSNNGSVALSLIGQVPVQGLTVTQAEEKIKNLYLGDYLKKPDVTITIVEYRQFYVNGEVNKPGGYAFREGMTVQRAITLAGGFTERASRKTVQLLNESADGKPKEVSLAESVRPGDVITVEESFF